ncbi:hypothetical protein RUM44_012527 [Polyplax serrata]|uniref:Uncharacterized protein n=1 Tax=Polyplax serrata TaxID=468196 RepID=A0ABR1BBL1_POLSC
MDPFKEREDFQRGEEQIHIIRRNENRNELIRPLTNEEIELWNNCLKTGFFKTGVPFGILSYALGKYITRMVPKKVLVTGTTPKSLLGTFAIFTLNCFIGSIFYAPICYEKLREKFEETQKKMNVAREEKASTLRGTEGLFGSDDSFQSSLDTKADGPLGSFSHLNLDINSSIVENISDDINILDEKTPVKGPEMTYEQLRWRNRNNYSRSSYPISSDSDRITKQSISDTSLNKAPPQDIAPPRPKNKYGDDME